MSSEPRQKKKSIMSDPYAGQYPPPPPLSQSDLGIEENQQLYQQQEDQQQQQHQQQQPFYIIDPTLSSNQRNSFSSAKRPSFHEDSRSTAHVSIGAPSNHSIQDSQQSHRYDIANSSHNNNTENGGYDDPEAVDLREYLFAERQEKLRQQELETQQNKQQRQSYSALTGVDMSDAYRHQHPPPRPEQVFYNNENSLYSSDTVLYNNNTVASPLIIPPLPLPMLSHQQSSAVFTPSPVQQHHQQQQQFMSPFRQPQLGQQSSTPSLMPPIVPPLPPPPPLPMMLNDKYARRRHGYCCLGLSLCSCLWTLILLVILIAGIALIVIAKVFEDKCTASNEYAESNGTLCNQVLHDGFLYGGIVVAGLSAIIVVWRAVKWSCFYRRRK
ncbi:hypothetical protein [Parasitella parasitica]|uniref:Uncharacterized protein n=1 Tax=Parasitella parasitica TaxID=35722 RepID=A0A0B7NEF8_9FUNG|nr:hypothetical protein [Parasitella parasitica]